MRYVLVTPAHNEEGFIEKTVASVIGQTLKPVRYVIVDDGSSDRTADLVRDVLARSAVEVERAGCTVSIQGQDGVVGNWDRSRIDQVLCNLLSNAIKFGAGKPIEIVYSAEAGAARLTMRDHGVGVAADDRDRIFGRFERAVSHKHYGGLGLGLYISRRIVGQHGGSIRCERQPGAESHGSRRA